MRSSLRGPWGTDRLCGLLDFLHARFAGRAARKQVVACCTVLDRLRFRDWPLPGGTYPLIHTALRRFYRETG
jgi:hypothetical protein